MLPVCCVLGQGGFMLWSVDAFAACSLPMQFLSGCVNARPSVFLNHNGVLPSVNAITVGTEVKRCDDTACCVSVGSSSGVLQLFALLLNLF